MPIQFFDLDTIGYNWGGEGDLDSSSFIDELEFYTPTANTSSTSPSSTVLLNPTAAASMMGATSAALMPVNDSFIKIEMAGDDQDKVMLPVVNDSFCKIEPTDEEDDKVMIPVVNDPLCKIEVADEESYLSMSPPDPFKFSDFYELTATGDDVITGDEIIINSTNKDNFDSGVEVILIHDCMWAGGCSACEHEARTLARQSSTCSSTNSSSSSCSSNNSSSDSETSSNCGGSNKDVLNDNLRTGQSSLSILQPSQINNNLIRPSCSSNISIANNCSSPSSHTNSNSSSCNSNNNLNSSSSCSSPSNNNNNSNSSVVQTIEVPSVSGQFRRTGVIVQKTVGRSLLIKSRTKSEINSSRTINSNSNSNSCSNNSNNINVSSPAAKSNIIHGSHVSLIGNSLISSIPTPPITNSRPETPQSLSESEDDTGALDLSSVFLNIDNLKPPQGDLWDEVWAAVEEEHASGIEIPFGLIAGNNVNDSNNNKIGGSTLPDNDDDLSSLSSLDECLTSPVKIIKSCKSPSKTSSGAGASLSQANNNIVAAATTVVCDHSYDKRAWIRLEDLGVQTPSDSEDEIDVVSLVERSRASSRSSSTSSSSGSIGLPTNPSAKDQEEIQVITTSKLLNASRAVSRRLRTKLTNRSKVHHHHPCNKRRLSDFDEYKSSNRLSKKPRIYCKGKSRFATDSESDSKEKRDMHNNMERMRRIDLRNSFEELKALVPSLVVKERAPKVQILQEAASYCTELKFESRKLATQVAALKKEQERLRGTVSGLRRSLAAHR